MPLYEYECKECGRRTEKIQKFADAPLTVCPHCGGLLERTLTAPAIQFKGGGWYKDLYSSAKPAAKSGEAKAGEGSKPGDGAKTGGESAASSSDSSSSSGASSSSGSAAATTSAPAAGNAKS